MKKFLAGLLLASFCMLSFCFGCSQNNSDNNDHNVNDSQSTETYSIILSTNSVNLTVGETYNLFANVSPSSATISWTSSVASVATVNSGGKITAKSAGETTITASVRSDVKASCVITVKNEESEPIQPIQPATIILSKTQLELDIGDSFLLEAIINPNDNNQTISWSSTNEDVVTVEDGLLHGISKGIAFIQASAEGCTSAVCTVEVKEVFGSISGTITCYSNRTKAEEVDVKTKI